MLTICLSFFFLKKCTVKESPFAFSSLFYPPFFLPEVASILELVFIFIMYDFIIFTHMCICGHLSTQNYFVDLKFLSPTPPLVLHPSFLASLISLPSHPPRKRKAGTVRQPALGCCFSVLGPFLQVLIPVLKDPHLALTLGLGTTPLTVLPVPSAAFTLAAPVLNHFNFSL